MKKTSVRVILTNVWLIIFLSLSISNTNAASLHAVISDTTYELSAVDQKPEIQYKEHPYYPEHARKNRTEGTVIITITIDKKGRVQKAVVTQSVRGLDQAAIDAAMHCKFKPAKKNGKAVTVKMDIPYKFKLK